MFYRTSVPTVFDMFFFCFCFFNIVTGTGVLQYAAAKRGGSATLVVIQKYSFVVTSLMYALLFPGLWSGSALNLLCGSGCVFFSMQIRLSKITLGLCEFAVIDH